ncbi:MAG: zinc metallopeptidase [Ruminococcaceae bacterium]|nr:zinc metallopeptidase [Oscillospiraceae bacterium]
MFIFFDWTFWVFMVPAFLIGLWAQSKVTSAYNKYSKIKVAGRITGYDAARAILNANGLYHVQIERIGGTMTDHFDPRSNVLRLSAAVYDTASVAAVGIAAHECGHAIQYAQAYAPMKVRGALVSVTNFSSMFSMIFVVLGLIFSSPVLAYFGVGLFAIVALFQLITLPVEFNASRRAIDALEGSGAFKEEELDGVDQVLTAAALTYVAALVSAVLQLLRLLVIARNSDR